MSTASHSVEMLRAMSVARKTVDGIRPFDPDTAERTDAVLQRMQTNDEAPTLWETAYPELLAQAVPAKRALVRILLKQIDQAIRDARDADSPL